MKVYFLSGLKEIAGREELDIQYAGRLSYLLESLCKRYGDAFRRVLVDPDNPGERSPFLKILVDREVLEEEDPELKGDETVFLFLPIAGG